MKSTYTCAGITCEGCANAIKKAVSKLPDVSQVDVDVSSKRVTVSHEDLETTQAIETALRKAGFQPA
ncbi:MAG: heavy metal-associated domain-containing protein [Gemmataceae bacterium]